MDTFTAPSYPPPLLTSTQILSLATQGHLLLPLSKELQDGYDHLSKLSNTFFAQPDTSKSSLYPNDNGKPELGFTHNAGEKQYLTLRARTGSNAASLLEITAARVWRGTAVLLQRVLADLARAMDLPDSDHVWDSILDGALSMPDSSAASTPTILRMFDYVPGSGAADPHTDIGLLTLCVCAGKGLQVSTLTEKSGADGGSSWQWKDVEGPTLLIGSALRALTGNSLRAGLHRVVANPEGRTSIIFALRPSLRHRVALSSFGGGIEVELEDFWRNILHSRYNINAGKEDRERQKKALVNKKHELG